MADQKENKELFKVRFQQCSGNSDSLPFWAWNGDVNWQLAEKQLPVFQQMGMGGFVIHSRTGLKTPFLGTEYMDTAERCVEYAAGHGMQVWLYDEDRWPSGYGGGLVTENPSCRPRYLVISTWKKEEIPGHTLPSANGRLDLIPRGDGKLRAVYSRTQKSGKTDRYYVYEETMGDTSWFNGQAYLDTLNPRAVEAFLDTVYETYRKHLSAFFGKTVTAVFTDEPQMLYKRVFMSEEQNIQFGRQEGDWAAVLPYSEILGEKFWSDLPLILWGRMKKEAMSARYRYHRVMADQFFRTYCDRVGVWCADHRIKLTGHLRGEGRLQAQTASLGEAMRNYAAFSVPGIDILCDRREYSTVKQAQSVARQMNKEGVASEMYGVTGWEFDFAGHKLQGDWQAALGVTHRVHHLAWMTMEGEAKRDFPASIFYQLPWYRQYRRLEEYFGRIGMALKRGKQVVRIAVIHPVESFWMVYGDRTLREEGRRLERTFADLTVQLLQGLLDFDYISEALMEEKLMVSGKRVGAVEYDAVVIPGIYTLRKRTEEFLEAFQQAGGRIFLLGKEPEFLDGIFCGKKKEFWKRVCRCERENLLEELETFREVDILDENGSRSCNFVHQLREETEGRWLFIAPMERKADGGIRRIGVRGIYRMEQWNPEDGTTAELVCRSVNGWTWVCVQMYSQDSLLLFLRKETCGYSAELIEESVSDQIPAFTVEKKRILAVVQELQASSYRLEEDNVAVLTQAEWRLGNSSWEKQEELLHLETHLRRIMGYEKAGEYGMQPWVQKKDHKAGSGKRSRDAVQNDSERQSTQLTLRFSVDAAERFTGIRLAGERLQEKKIFLDGIPVIVPERAEDLQWYVDRSIRCLPLPEIAPGRHVVTVEMEFNRQAHLEWFYLLGDFGAEAASPVCLQKRAELVGFGPWKDFGLPFYGGNLTYECQIDVEEGEYILEIRDFAAPLLSIRLDETEVGIIALEPYRISLGRLSGFHSIAITAYGNRINTFGAIHNSKESIDWYGPGTWRSSGEDFTSAYHLRNTGILKPPLLKRIL